MIVRLLISFALCAAVFSSAPIPQHLLNEWSQFQADDEFYHEMNSFLETGSTTTGGDFEFKCETTCQLVQSATASAAHASRAAAQSLLQTAEGVAGQKAQKEVDVSKQVEDAFYNKMDAFLETESKTTSKATAGGDFEFKCETTCQLVQTTTAASKASAANANAHANSLIQTDAGKQEQPRVERSSNEAGLQNNLELEAQSKAAAKDCYRLCLNPSMNPGCDAASSVVSLLEIGTTTYEALAQDTLKTGGRSKNWSLGNGSGNCLNNCVHVCMAVKDPASS